MTLWKKTTSGPSCHIWVNCKYGCVTFFKKTLQKLQKETIFLFLNQSFTLSSLFIFHLNVSCVLWISAEMFQEAFLSYFIYDKKMFRFIVLLLFSTKATNSGVPLMYFINSGSIVWCCSHENARNVFFVRFHCYFETCNSNSWTLFWIKRLLFHVGTVLIYCSA